MNAHCRGCSFFGESELFAAKRIPPSSTRKEHHAFRDDTAKALLGYGPSGILGVILIVVLVLVLLGKV